MKLDVITLDGAKAGSDRAARTPSSASTTSAATSWQRCVNWQLAKRRAGTHKMQTRNENLAHRQEDVPAEGHRRRPSRLAPRAPSSSAAPRAFGPVVRSHDFDLPKKVRALALRHALSSKAKAGALVVLEDGGARRRRRPPPCAPSSPSSA